ncbi:hypothetical protein RIF25_01030 [Thermosynechococcaceae cyanobacterium BACA0444]|uniref:DUF6671 domain-containing protein n=1 Tax=Pseudocalidococcus azoricus BACA0444 TaxID=2918990 RepID=A0AAE4JWX5_9CYAN|nr:DUF6671 family protein [Pseudocalidococcus azoricus]MDS3859379.1 hypothetical protein [Pseudocalidococcus azoricus BACA0444]
MSFFAGRVAVLGTKHQKEQVIAPILAEAGITLTVPPEFDSDCLGTFSREKPRQASPLITARQKAALALSQAGGDLGLASEGSFGPHPQMPMLPANHELVILIDPTNHLELVGEAWSVETNFAHRTVANLGAALEFAEKVGFPTHGLIVMPQAQPAPTDPIWKGITTAEALETALQEALSHSPTGTVHLETDMRAMFNPTRMQVIAQATQNLLTAIQSPCPRCECPGFTLSATQPGLPCGWCGGPTGLPKLGIYRCQQCHWQESRLYPLGLEVADPGQCPYCNP